MTERLWAVYFEGHILTPDDKVRRLFQSRKAAEDYRRVAGFTNRTIVRKVEINLLGREAL